MLATRWINTLRREGVRETRSGELGIFESKKNADRVSRLAETYPVQKKAHKYLNLTQPIFKQSVLFFTRNGKTFSVEHYGLSGQCQK